MNVLSASRSVRVLLLVLLVLGLVAVILPRTEFYLEWRFEGKSKSREGGVQKEVINSSPENKAVLAPPAPNGSQRSLQIDSVMFI
jgi:hypothetical protein